FSGSNNSADRLPELGLGSRSVPLSDPTAALVTPTSPSGTKSQIGPTDKHPSDTCPQNRLHIKQRNRARAQLVRRSLSKFRPFLSRLGEVGSTSTIIGCYASPKISS